MSLSAAQPERSTISCTIAVRSGVRWARPASPTVVQAAGVQADRGVGGRARGDVELGGGEGGRIVAVLAPDQQRRRAGAHLVDVNWM